MAQPQSHEVVDIIQNPSPTSNANVKVEESEEKSRKIDNGISAINGEESSKKKALSQTSKKNEKTRRNSINDDGVEVELTLEEQWERVNLLLIILAIILAMNATLWTMIAGIWIHSSDILQRVVMKEVTKVSGFPTLHMGLLTNEGFMDDFTIDGSRNPSLPKLQKTKQEPAFIGLVYYNPAYEIFGVYYDNHIHYIYSNPQSLVTKYDLRDGKFRSIPNSNILNTHVSRELIGFQVGKYFWLLGGYEYHDGWTGISQSFEAAFFKHQTKTCLWAFEKESWLEGPRKPSDLDISCVVGINATTAAFIGSMPTKGLFIFDFTTQSWKKMPLDITPALEYCTTTVYHTKSYERRLIILGSLLGDLGVWYSYSLDSLIVVHYRQVFIPKLVFNTFGFLINMRGNLFYLERLDSDFQRFEYHSFIYKVNTTTGAMKVVPNVTLFSNTMENFDKYDYEEFLDLHPIKIIPYMKRRYAKETIDL